ncbi:MULTISPECIES: alpha/beta fold hydrolase [Burkholderiaceae]|uniref:Alpha/beta hydrolase fold protein n=2 Tax=Burkholderiaceae TaxID=119060 RepID=A0A158GJD6_9BURK|nr:MULTISPECIES: alpha/beta hydrolase [Burkholderiaceae]CAE6848491.1 2-hydroxy-6-oxo-2,4-heptadienoate hydrolase [Paraburkholderia aspalathi]SAL32132.1 alpha/beta hydrolase fold protein [Caballeronia udeis]
MSESVEIANNINADGINTNYHDCGSGVPVLLIHGSGPGVTAWANWRLTIPDLSTRFRVIAPDMVGFGYTERPPGIRYDMGTWVKHALGLLDALEIDKVHVVGNSFGGALALAMAISAPDRVRRLVLMGSVGVSFPITDGLDRVWGYTPSIENMRGLLDVFAYDRNLVNDELARLRYEASIRPNFQEAFSSMFPAPRQRWVDAMASREEDIRSLPHETLIVHGREDRVIPLSNSEKLFEMIPHAQFHAFGGCGHWTQIEHGRRFNRLVGDFFDEGAT